MNEHLKNGLIATALLALIGLGAWWWQQAMEKRWQATPHVSDAARENRMLAATQLLRQSGHRVTLAGSLGEVVLDQLPDGTLIVGDASGVVAPDKAQKLLAWVRRGNTLVAQPRWASPTELAQIAASKAEDAKPEVEDAEENENEDEGEVEGKGEGKGEGEDGEPAAAAHEDASTTDEEEPEEDSAPPAPQEARRPAPRADLVEVDPLAAYLGVRLRSDRRNAPCPTPSTEPPAVTAGSTPKASCNWDQRNQVYTSAIAFPNAPYALDLNPGSVTLVSMPRAAVPALSDQQDHALRLYHEGRGRIVMVAADYFANHQLQRYDHGELLLTLARLHGQSKQVTIVKNLDMPRWYRALWDRYSQFLIALALTLALLLWAALRRFGPLLPEPDRERRALMEHIDASGAWLWNAPNGRGTLLDAARAETEALLRRRAPALLRMAPRDRARVLAADCKLPEADVDQALYADALSDPQHFTRQIRTLQTLRNHYER